MQDGRSRSAVLAEIFIFSDEMMKKGLSDREYVKVLYRTFMGREADAAGLNYWVGRLQAGTSRKLVMKQFAGYPEFSYLVLPFLTRFQKIKKIQLLKAGGYMKTITREKYLDRIIERVCIL